MNDLLAFFAAFVGLAGELLDEWILLSLSHCLFDWSRLFLIRGMNTMKLGLVSLEKMLVAKGLSAIRVVTDKVSLTQVVDIDMNGQCFFRLECLVTAFPLASPIATCIPSSLWRNNLDIRLHPIFKKFLLTSFLMNFEMGFQILL